MTKILGELVRVRPDPQYEEPGQSGYLRSLLGETLVNRASNRCDATLLCCWIKERSRIQWGVELRGAIPTKTAGEFSQRELMSAQVLGT